MVEWTSSSLVWPQGVERSAAPVAGRSGPKAKKGVAEVLKALDLLATVTFLPVSDVVLSYAAEADFRHGGDGGAAVWFVWGEVRRCVPCDLYGSPGANLSAIAQLIRGCIAEHGRGAVAAVAHALSSYTLQASVPSGVSADRHWSNALGVRRDASSAEVTAAFRRLANKAHPDKGGTREQWDEAIDALRQARHEIARSPLVRDQQAVVDEAADEAIWARLFPDAR